mmetsp:Transcript_41367/g.67103  ORF Transcript_41367/g.67103 Transcript_41367/m.67103 type:complete len:226 (-) Transcript_41367:189-866(-)
MFKWPVSDPSALATIADGERCFAIRCERSLAPKAVPAFLRIAEMTKGMFDVSCPCSGLRDCCTLKIAPLQSASGPTPNSPLTLLSASAIADRTIKMSSKLSPQLLAMDPVAIFFAGRLSSAGLWSVIFFFRDDTADVADASDVIMLFCRADESSVELWSISCLTFDASERVCGGFTSSNPSTSSWRSSFPGFTNSNPSFSSSSSSAATLVAADVVVEEGSHSCLR